MKNIDLTEQVLNKIRIRNFAKKNMGENDSIDSTADETDGLTELFSDLENVNRYWDISGEYMIRSHRRILGGLIVSAKKAIRKLLRWYINPIMNQQRLFNAHTTRTLNIMKDLMLGLNQEVNETKAYVIHMENSIANIKDDIRSIKDIVEYSADNIDYFEFEKTFRGTRDEIKERQRIYLPHFIDKEVVLDIGCGRGEFVELLSENNISVRGIDSNTGMVKYCQDLGLNVQHADAFNYLNNIEDGSLDGIFMAQVAEHLPSKKLVELIGLCSGKLKSNGVFIMETPNPMSLIVFAESFYMDLTHIRPVHPGTAKFICESFGFNVELKFTAQVPDMEKLSYPNEEEKTVEAVDKLNNLIYGPRDYAVICHKR